MVSFLVTAVLIFAFIGVPIVLFRDSRKPADGFQSNDIEDFIFTNKDIEESIRAVLACATSEDYNIEKIDPDNAEVVLVSRPKFNSNGFFIYCKIEDLNNNRKVTLSIKPKIWTGSNVVQLELSNFSSRLKAQLF